MNYVELRGSRNKFFKVFWHHRHFLSNCQDSNLNTLVDVVCYLHLIGLCNRWYLAPPFCGKNIWQVKLFWSKLSNSTSTSNDRPPQQTNWFLGPSTFWLPWLGVEQVQLWVPSPSFRKQSLSFGIDPKVLIPSLSFRRRSHFWSGAWRSPCL